MSLSIIVARAANGVIGNDNKLIWHLPDDLKMFKSRTMGRPIIMGRKTFESLPKVLPGRVHYVLTGNRAYTVPEGVYVFHTVKELLSVLPEGENFIIGGEKMYEAMFPYADKMYITEIEKEYNGDAVFPSFRKEEWKETESVMGKGDPVHRFVTYERVPRKRIIRLSKSGCGLQTGRMYAETSGVRLALGGIGGKHRISSRRDRFFYASGSAAL